MRDFAHDLVQHIAEGHGHEEEVRMALRGEGAPEEGGSKVDCPACGLSQPLSSVGDHYKSCIEQLYQSFDAGQQKKKILCTTCGKALPKSRYDILISSVVASKIILILAQPRFSSPPTDTRSI